MTRVRFRFRHVPMFALVLIIAACAPPLPDDTVTIAVASPPTNLDPRIGTDAVSERLFELIYGSLVRRSPTMDLDPSLAQSWDLPDDRTYVFHLRDDVRFHDGSSLDSSDVLYSFRTMMDGTVQTAKGATALSLIEEMAADGEHTVRFHLSEPFAPFLWNLSNIAIIPDGSGETSSDRPPGTGPFVLEQYRVNSEVVLRRNPDYFGAPASIERAIFKVVPEAVVRGLELRKGTVDIVLNELPPDMVEVLRDESGLRVLEAPGTNYQYLAFNVEDPVFRDVRVRQAIAYAVDRDTIVEYLWRGQARPADSLLPPENWAYFDGVRRYPYDPARARALLEEAGQTDLEFTYKTSQDETGRLVAAVLQQQFGDVGITMSIRSNEFATFFADVLAGNFQMYSLRWIGGNNDPDLFNLVFHSGLFPPNGANRGRYVNQTVDRLIERARREPDIEARREDYAEIQRIVSEELPYVSLWYPDNVAVYNERIEGLWLFPTGNFEFLPDIRIRQP